jgi:hypothetical protein
MEKTKQNRNEEKRREENRFVYVEYSEQSRLFTKAKTTVSFFVIMMRVINTDRD